MFDIEEMRRATRQGAQDQIEAESQEVANTITQCCSKGRYTAVVEVSYPELLIKLLREKGFKVTATGNRCDYARTELHIDWSDDQ